MTGYQEIFSDPSYCDQIVVMTYPHIGNTGVNLDDFESKRLDLKGVVVRDYSEAPSSWRATRSLGALLEEAKVPGITGVDTRRITFLVREGGAQRAVLFPVENEKDIHPQASSLLRAIAPMEGRELVSRVSTPRVYEYPLEGTSEIGKRLVVYDFGVKVNTLRELRRRGFQVWVVPYNTPASEVMQLKPSGVVLSNGPGDPAEVKGSVEEIGRLVGRVPILAICMGHQLLARALGAKTYKLKFGHHGVNHPVKDLVENQILITSQNHGFSVSAESLTGDDITLSHVSANDNTLEGFLSQKMRLYSVQFHPEASPGPSDAKNIFDRFLRGFVQ